MTIRQDFDAGIRRDYYRGKTDAALEELEANGLRLRRAEFTRLLEADAEFYVLHGSVNIAASWMSLLAVTVVEDFAGASDGGDPLDEQIAALAFFSRLSNELWAIIELVEIGFDLQARALTRGFLEHVDVLICCINNRQITNEFVNALEPQDANAFWHRNVSKNKAKKLVSKFLSDKIGIDGSKLVDLLREDADLSGSMLLHPTATAGISTAFGHEDGGYSSYPIFPLPIAASAGVFRSILNHLLWLQFAMGPLPKVGHGTWSSLLQTEDMQDNLEIDRMSLIYSRMLDFVLNNHLLMRPKD